LATEARLAQASDFFEDTGLYECVIAAILQRIGQRSSTLSACNCEQCSLHAGGAIRFRVSEQRAKQVRAISLGLQPTVFAEI
jgi:hypothetical protein